MYKNLVSQTPNPNKHYNLSSALKSTLTNSHHEWQYCFLERGGDTGEIYLSAKQLLET
jgi:hypothetical protein